MKIQKLRKSVTDYLRVRSSSEGLHANYTLLQRLSSLLYSTGLQTTARGPNAAREAILSNDEKKCQNFVDLVECNISQINHIT